MYNDQYPQENKQDNDEDYIQSSYTDDKRKELLNAFGQKLAKKRKEAQDGRKSSGIEDKWADDDDHYNGIDDANRQEMMLKSPSVSGSPYYLKPAADDQVRSTVFVNITQPYVDMAAARVADMLLPTDDIPFKIKPTPIPEIMDAVDDQNFMPDGQATVGQAAQSFIQEAEDKADKAETQIWDWLVESDWHNEARKCIEQAARIGTSCLKGPFPSIRKRRKMSKGDDGTIQLVIEEELVPTTAWRDIRNIYPDPSCGNKVSNGSYLFEKDFISVRQLKELKAIGGYINEEIDELLKEGPGRRWLNDRGKALESEKYEIWYYHGTADSEDMQSARQSIGDNTIYEDDEINVMVVMINDRVIKASLSILESGEFPYDFMVWQRNTDHWAGTGVARQIRTPQRIINAATRLMLDNAGVSAGPQIIIRRGAVTPADKTWNLTPMKIWYVDDDAVINDVRTAFTTAIIPSLQNEIDAIIKYGFELCEKSTNMPLLMQGSQGNATETVGGMTMLDRNASSVLRRIAKICDDDVTEPHVERYYEWLMIYGKDDSCKGDMQIQALGSTAFFQRDAENQAIIQLLPMSKDSDFNLDPDKLMIEYLKMQRISPERVRYSEQQIAQMKQAKDANPPIDPKVQGMIEVEKLRQQGDIQKEQMRQQVDQSEMQADAAINQSDIALKIHLAQQEHNNKKELLQMQLNLEAMKLSQVTGMSLDKIKADLSQTAQKLNVQKQLSQEALVADAGKQGREHAHEINTQVLTPPTEPVGRAQDGQAYSE